MTLKLSAWGEAIGISAVVLSLVFVGYELRQSSTIAAVDAGQQLAQMGQELTIFASHSDVAAIVLKAESDYASLDPVEQLQFTGLVLSTFNLWEHAYYSHTEGVLSDELWTIWHESNCELLPLPWFEAFKENGSGGFLPGFIELQRSCYDGLKRKVLKPPAEGG